ncbi:MAG: RluA family pseudouridine synthase [Clostridia bacterium]|nr:RluA family pseudouridine synthase [Clostridia bacterium]
MFEFNIGKNDAGQRLDKFLTKAMPAMPMPMMYRLIRQKKIKLNRKRAEISSMLAEGDTVLVFAPPHFAEKEKEAPKLTVTADPDIVYEDENIMLVNKPSGLLVHDGDAKEAGKITLVRMIQDYLIRKGEYEPAKENSFAPALANRIDRNTGGIVLAAKNAAALRELEDIFRDRKINKKYLCVVHGVPKKSVFFLEHYLLKDEKTKNVRVYGENHPSAAKYAKTGCRVLSFGKNYSLIEAELFTGRTHQIRAQLAHAGHPLLGDGKYGINKGDRSLGYSSQALCSYYVRFENNEDGFLGYLKGKEFSLDPNTVDFVKDYNSRLKNI